MEVCRNRASGKYFIFAEDVGDRKGMFVAPGTGGMGLAPRVVSLKLELFTEPVDVDSELFLNEKKITPLMLDLYRRWCEEKAKAGPPALKTSIAELTGGQWNPARYTPYDKTRTDGRSNVMRTIRISDEVWEEIAKRGKFGETPEDVLARVFGIDKNTPGQQPPTQNFVLKTRQRIADVPMSSKVKNGRLTIRFHDGPSKDWPISKSDTVQKIREVRKEACEFARLNGATFGQIMAVKKAFTNAGIYVSK